MTPRLREISIDTYARTVLPQTHSLWGRGLSLDAYVTRNRDLAVSTYGKSAFRRLGLTEGNGEIVASFKRYERFAHVDAKRLRAVGIGAVFTSEELRGRGLASAMLALALDDARAEGFDLAFLFSDIHPQFYKSLGFFELPSRTISVRADSLEWSRLRVEPISLRDWSGIRACFDAAYAGYNVGLDRPATFWSWVRALLATGGTRTQRVDLAVRQARGRIACYLLGRRETTRDTYVVDEFGYVSDRAKETVPALLRYAAGDLRRIAGWLPPAPARSILPRGSVRKRSDAVLMAAPLSEAGRDFITRARNSGAADPLWSTDHI